MRPGNLTASKALFLQHEELLSAEGQTHRQSFCSETSAQRRSPVVSRCDFWQVWPGALMTRREPLSSAYGQFLQPMEVFPRRSVLFHPKRIKKLQALSLPFRRCKSLVNRAWSQRQPCFSMNMYDSQASPHAVCLGDFGERWPQ